jgi:DNA-binding CsgD family transcriptional regulator
MRRNPSPVDQLTQTLQHVRVPSFIVGSNGVVTWANDAARATFGATEGRPFGGIIAPEDVGRARQQLDRKLRGVAATDYDLDVITQGGVRRRAEISSVRIAGGDRCHAVFGVVLPGRRRLDVPRNAALTPRQSEVLALLADGLSTEQIAAELQLSRETVRNHVRGMLRALGVHSRVEALALARHAEPLDA